VAASASAFGLTSKTFSGTETSIHYVEGPANGPPLVLLHGLTRDWASFSVLLPALVPSFHIFALDLRGHGASGRVKNGYRISAIAEDVTEFLRSTVSSPASLFGHSLGGMVGMCAAANNTTISALIVGDSLISPDNLATMYDPIFSQLHQLLLRGWSEQELGRGIGKIEIHFSGINEAIRLEELPANSGDVLLEWARSAMLTDPEALRMTIDRSSHAGWNPEHILPQIACPVLLLQGNPEFDALLSDSDVALATKLLPRSEHVKFPLLGHALFMQNPRPVLDAILRFVSSVRPESDTVHSRP
jgi:pimeloyl-ACP methyl ester carboxylesterase